MKLASLILPLLLFCVTGCAQKDAHNFHASGRISIDASRWYQLTNASAGLDELFDGKIEQKPNTGYNKLVDPYEAWYTLQQGESMTLDSIMMYCYRGIDADKPMTLYAVTADFKRTPLAVFKGQQATTWQVFKPKEKTAGIRYLIIHSWGQFPAEVELYGSYTPPAKLPETNIVHPPLLAYMGINAYEWNFESEQGAGALDPGKLATIHNFTAVRHYLDWGKLEPAPGSYTFNPARDGGWDYDTMYRWCADQHIDVLACIKTTPKWMEETYPSDKRNYENIPARYGSNLSDPASYKEQAQLAFQFAARYGATKVNTALLRVDGKPRWTADKTNGIRTGLGTIHYVECDNERDKWWKGRTAYQTGREYAANLSAFYDGHKGALGPAAGIKQADPTMQVVMGGLANPDPGYVQGMIDWSRQHRGLHKDGSVDLPWDIINYHYYANNGTRNNEPTQGIAPEAAPTERIASAFTELVQRNAPGMPIWVTEAGYDVNQQSTQRVVPEAGNDVLATEANWILRTSLIYARTGVQRLFFYQLYDDNATSTIKYGTSGLANDNRTPRPAADYLRQVNAMFGNYTYVATISNKPMVDKYTYNDQIMYVLWQTGEKPLSYSLNVDKSLSALICTPVAGQAIIHSTTVKVINSKVTVPVSSTPTFIMIIE